VPIRPVNPNNPLKTDTDKPPVRSRSRSTGQVKGNTPTPELTEQEKPKEGDYTVGYGKPPVATRFKPGKSGNPKGRPKAAKGLNTIVRKTLTQKVSVRTANGEQRISRIEAALHKTVELAMKGNPRALAQLIKLYADAVPDAQTSVDQRAPDQDLTATDLAILEELQRMLMDEEEPAR
jgi:hypothetical protein